MFLVFLCAIRGAIVYVKSTGTNAPTWSTWPNNEGPVSTTQLRLGQPTPTISGAVALSSLVAPVQGLLKPPLYRYLPARSVIAVQVSTVHLQNGFTAHDGYVRNHRYRATDSQQLCRQWWWGRCRWQGCFVFVLWRVYWIVTFTQGERTQTITLGTQSRRGCSHPQSCALLESAAVAETACAEDFCG